MRTILIIIIGVIFISNCFGQSCDEYLYDGGLKLNENDYYGAILDFSKAIEINPTFPDAFRNRGLAKFNIQNYKGAISDYTTAIEINKEDSKAYFERGLSEIFIEQFDNGCLDFNKALADGYKDAKQAIEIFCISN